jgi:hypothetical protein
MKNIFTFSLMLALVAILFVQNAKAVGGVTVTGSGGSANATYGTLKAAFDALNLVTTQAGNNIVITISASTTETATAQLNQPSVSSWTSLAIYPTVTGLTVSTAFLGPLITLNGADNVTIDGRLNGTGSTVDLTLLNSNQNVITLRVGATYNTIKYCNLKGSDANNYQEGVIHFKPWGVNTPNSNNTIEYNNITNGGTRLFYAISSNGMATSVNAANTIRFNNIYDWGNPANNINGIYCQSYNSGWTIQGNSFYETTSLNVTATTFPAFTFINVQGNGGNFVISGNYMGGTAPNCGGTPLTKSGGNRMDLIGIDVEYTGTGTTEIQGNTFQNIAWSSTTYSSIRGMIIGCTGNSNIGTTTGNTIGAATGNNSIVLTNSGTSGDFMGLSLSSSGTTDCANNIIGAIQTANTNSLNGNNFSGIYIGASATTSVRNNIIGSTDAGTTNSINASSASSSIFQSVLGINSYPSAGTAVTISGNTISKMVNAQTINGETIGISLPGGTNTVTNNSIHDLVVGNSSNEYANAGIRLRFVATTAQTITGNTIYNISNPNSGFTNSINGIYYSGGTIASTVSGNFIHSLSVNAGSNGASLYGIKINGGSTTYSNNIVSLGGNTNTIIYGINESGSAGNNNNLYFNTVYISGAPTSGSFKSYALYSNNYGNTRDFRNNIFYNARSNNGATGKHYALYHNSGGSTGLTEDYNDYYVSGTNGMLGYNYGDKSSLASLQSATGQDASSLNTDPGFASAGGTNAADYIPGTLLPGTPVATFTTDYSGSSRSGTPTMGAYEFRRITVTGSTGANNDYTTLKDALTAINNNTNQNGNNIVIKINLSTTESATASLTGQATNSWASLTIYPTVTGLTISGNFAGPVITLDGADNVTIDGRLNATGAASDMTITSSAGQAIYFQAGANSNTIKYCTLKGSLSNATAGGIIHFAAGTGGNNNNIIDYNNITNGGTRVSNAVYAVGSSGNVNSGNMIRYNAFYDHLSPSAYGGAIKIDDYNSAWTISGNSFYETTTFSPVNIYEYSFIWIPGTTAAARGNGYTVSGNYIGGKAPQCGGSALTKAYTSAGMENMVNCIYMNVGTGTASNVLNNTIQNISWTNGPLQGKNFYGIYVANGDVNVGSTAGTGNIIGSNDGTGSITFSGSTSSQSFYGIYIQSANTVNCNYNKIGTITTASADATKPVELFGIYQNSAGTITLSNNTIGSSSGGSSSLFASSTSTSSLQRVAGIYCNNAASLTITNNTICGLSNAATSSVNHQTAGIIADACISTITGNTISNLTGANNNTQLTNMASVTGISLNGPFTTGGQTVTDNTIYNLSNSNPSFAGRLTGLYFAGKNLSTTTTDIVSKNFIYGFSLSGISSTAASFCGICTGGGKTIYSNNIITLGGNTPTTVYGIYNSGNNATEKPYFYFNTVYLSGSLASGATNKSYAYYCPLTGTQRNIRNNIFANARSTVGGTSLHYAFSSLDGNSQANYLTLDYNDYYVSGIGGVLGYCANTDKTILPLVTSGDDNSEAINPLFASAGGTVAANYLPSAAYLRGVTGTGISEDYAGTARTYNAMGAYDYNMGPGKIHVVATAGTTPGDYKTLISAFAAINAGTHQGDITITINASTLETGTINLYSTQVLGTVNYTSITIYPTVAGLSISGNIAGNLLNFNGGDNVTIDGRVNQSGAMSLEINNTNTGTGASTITFYNDAQNNTIKYCTIKGSTTKPAGGVVSFLTTGFSTGNTGNTIAYCDITNAGGNRPVNTIYSSGTNLKYNSGNIIRKNHFYDLVNLSNNSSTINLADYNNSWTISGNSFYEKAPLGVTTSMSHTVINITNTNYAGTGFDVKDNYIGGSDSLCGGSAWTKNGGTNNAFTGIYLKAGVGTASSVQNNTIRNINYTNNSFASWYGINVTAGDVNVGTVTGNTIGASSGTNSIVLEASTASTGSLYGIYIISAAATVDCRNNVIGAITTINTPNTNAVNIYGIYKLTVSGTTTISNNSVGSTDAGTSNSINASSLSSGAAQSVWGIYSLGTGNVTISGNTVSKLTNGTTNSTPATAGLIRGIMTSGGTNTITNNTVRDITIGNANTASLTASSPVYGIYVDATAGAPTITGNTIYNISNSYESFAGVVAGLYVSTGYPSTLSGNFIHSLSVSASSTAASIYGLYLDGSNTVSNNIISLGGNTATTLYGIYDLGTTGGRNSKLYFNTVYIGGTPASTTNLSFGLYNYGNLTTRDYRNNIFSNTRSTEGSSNLHYAMKIVTPAGTGTITCGYNDYYTPGTGGILGYYGVDITSLPIVTGKDAGSLNTNPFFAGAGDLTPVSYKPAAALTGVSGTGVLYDYAGVLRGSLPVTASPLSMGAYEVIPVPVITQAVTSVANLTATGNGTIAFAGSYTNRGCIVYEYSNSDRVIGEEGVMNFVEPGSFGTGPFTAAITGLSGGTRYNVRAYATLDPTTSYGERVAFWTLANVPSAPTVNNATASTIDVAVNVNGNPAATEFCINETSTANYVQANGTLGAGAVWQTASAWGTKTVISLGTGNTYTFKVKARNGDNTETAYGPVAAAQTVAQFYIIERGDITEGVAGTGGRRLCVVDKNEYYQPYLKAGKVAVHQYKNGILTDWGTNGTFVTALNEGDIARDPANQVIYIAFISSDKSKIYTYKRATTDSDWVLVNTLDNPDAVDLMGNTVRLTFNNNSGTLFLGFTEITSKKVYLYELVSGTWTDRTGSSSMSCYNSEIEMAAYGNKVIISTVALINNRYILQVHSYDYSTQVLTNLPDWDNGNDYWTVRWATTAYNASANEYVSFFGSEDGSDIKPKVLRSAGGAAWEDLSTGLPAVNLTNSAWAASLVYNELTAKYSLFYSDALWTALKGYNLSGTTWSDMTVPTMYARNIFATTNYKDVYFLGQDTYETLVDIYSIIETPFRKTMNISAVPSTTSCPLTFPDRGVGNKVAVFIKSGSYVAPVTADATTYTADPAFGSGTQLGSSGWYCIYNGVGQAVTVTGLTAVTTYQVQALEYNGDEGSTNTQMYIGNASVTGNPISWATPSLTVTTTAITSITTTTAAGGGNVTGSSEAVTARGIVWNTSINPSLSSFLGKTTDGTGTGIYTSALTGLNPSTTYYVKAYATNSLGTGYGEQVSFTSNANCTNPASGGTIAAAQTICAGFAPAAFTSSVLPSGHTGTLEYKWQSSVTSSSADFTDIASSNSATYAPGILTATTWYKRLARVTCAAWTGAVSSNVLEVTVNQPSFVGAIHHVSDLQATGQNIKWYAAATGGTALLTTAVLANGNYYASQTVNACESTDRVEVTVALDPTPCVPTASTPQTPGSGATVASLTTLTGQNIRWYTVATGGSALLPSAVLVSGTYYASQTVSCTESSTRVAVTVTVP